MSISLSKPIVVGFVLGIAIGVPLFLMSFLMAFGICSDTSIAETLFPLALIVNPSLFSRPLLALALALIQYPLYGIILGIGWAQKGVRPALFVVCLIAVLAAHVTAVSFARHRVAGMWKERFSHMSIGYAPE